MKTQELKTNLEKSIHDIVRAFEKKQDLYFEFAIGDDLTNTLCFSNEYYFTLSDICHDLFTEQPKGLIIQWQDDLIEKKEEQGYINYKAYCMGKRYKKQ